MFSSLLNKLSVQTQARLGLWLVETFSESQDVALYDSEVHRLLSELNINFETYAVKPWYDYRDPAAEVWPIFILHNAQWLPVLLPNPFYERQSRSNLIEEPITLLLTE